jgi:hypothetical protein
VVDRPKWTDIAIVVLTVGIVFLGYMQWREMDSSGTQTDKIISADDRLAAANERFATAMENTVTQNQGALNETLGEMKKQSKAMQNASTASSKQVAGIQESNRISRESLESVQRAFLTLTNVDMNRLKRSAESHYYEFVPTYENTGATQATGSINYFNYGVLDDEPSEAAFIGEINLRSARATIGPKMTQGGGRKFVEENVIFGIDLGDNPLSTLPGARFNKHIVMWGWAAYQDVFPRTRPHITEFCQKLIGYQVAPDPNPAQMIRFSGAGCNHHNCTDEDCDDYKDLVKTLRKDGYLISDTVTWP